MQYFVTLSFNTLLQVFDNVIELFIVHKLVANLFWSLFSTKKVWKILKYFLLKIKKQQRVRIKTINSLFIKSVNEPGSITKGE